jgi:hypothetical protein
LWAAERPAERVRRPAMKATLATMNVAVGDGARIWDDIRHLVRS